MRIRMISLLRAALLPTLACASILGCATNNNSCAPTGFNLSVSSPEGAAPDHAAASPGNQEQFLSFAGAIYGPGCVVPLNIAQTHAQWTTSDPINVTISSANDLTNGLATCVGATSATVTATVTSGAFTRSTSATIICK